MTVGPITEGNSCLASSSFDPQVFGALHFGAITSAVVIDAETTGLDSERDRIVTLAMIEVDMTRLKDESIAKCGALNIGIGGGKGLK